MKFRIYFRPSIVVLALGLVAAAFWGAVWALSSDWRLLALPPAVFYLALFGLSAWALVRSLTLERWAAWSLPGRLLILAPHEDDCVISAGGIGVRNRRLGGATRVVYLAPDETPGMAERRSVEARAAWSLAGLDADDLRHLDLLPSLYRSDPQKLRRAVATLRSIIDDFNPTVIVVPMFEGGHVHHDMASALLDVVVTPQDRFDVFEAPEYSPYVSLQYTPHRIIALSARWLFGVVSYYGPPDGIDGRRISKMHLDPSDLDCKRRMLAAFVSQNAPSLVLTRSYPDRLVRWQANSQRSTPFEFDRSYLRFVLAARRVLPAKVVDRLFPVQLGTIGRSNSITDWRREWAACGNLDVRTHVAKARQ
jgi:LmbE family N-acetylglucosaminyl deacetylase